MLRQEAESQPHLLLRVFSHPIRPEGLVKTPRSCAACETPGEREVDRGYHPQVKSVRSMETFCAILRQGVNS